ncbi:nitroreductase/quinone reductase family protein [Mycobacterium sp. 4D054]|uniref:nitroreductase/quinone reductase family protein n=1 Tax=Mycobacterium sp. 4D054 TaxID=3457440 RepID=UPI003FD3EE23
MSRGIFDSPLVGVFNAGAARLIDAPVIGPVVRRAMVVIRYTGRRSGQTFQTPVNYQRSGDAVVIRVMAPDKKTWWRNFTGEGGPITLMNFDGADRTGHAVAAQDEQGRVTVRMRLNP